MSGHVPDLDEMADSNRPPSDPEFDREDTLTGFPRNGAGEHRESYPERPPPARGVSERPRAATHRNDPSTEELRQLEHRFSAAAMLRDDRLRRLELESIDRRFEKTDTIIADLRDMIVRSDDARHERQKQQQKEVLDRVEAIGAEMRSRTPGPAWKAIVIGMIAVGLLGLGGLGIFVYRGAVALEQIQQHQIARMKQQERGR